MRTEGSPRYFLMHIRFQIILSNFYTWIHFHVNNSNNNNNNYNKHLGSSLCEILLKLTREDLQKMDQMARKLMTMFPRDRLTVCDKKRKRKSVGLFEGEGNLCVCVGICRLSHRPDKCGKCLFLGGFGCWAITQTHVCGSAIYRLSANIYRLSHQ